MKRLALVAAAGSLAVAAPAELPEVPLKTGDRMHGFVVKTVADLPDIAARMVRLEFEKNGADLVWLARDDDNKTFAIAFKTPPEDDTGVAHILEHSVLCGSEKYPVKEPFVGLLKSSMATFLNAATWPHLTAYPVSTRNDRDFANLVGVYLDAVFRPLAVKNGWAWRQEGWHYEFDADGRLVRNGVVYSEMKGAMAGVDRRAARELDRLLFPDNCFGFNAGGDPERIPELTFEKYKAFYARHYHPSNARIFLDGKVDLAPTLALLETYLDAFGRAAACPGIPLQKPVCARRTLAYASPEEEGKVVLRDGWVWGTWENRLEALALDVVADCLADSNEAPLKKALVQAGLCEDVAFYADLDQQMKLVLVVRNTTRGKVAACRRAARAAIEQVCREGLDVRRLAAKLDNYEFRLREMDTGSFPRGIVLCDAMLGSWIFGGDPAAPFRISPRFAALRAKLGTDYFTDLLRQAVLDNGFRAELTLEPSRTLADERRAAEAAELAETLAGFTPAQRAAVAAEAKRLREIQSAADDPAQLAKLPRLARADIPVEGVYAKRTLVEIDGCPTVRPAVAANGVVYLTLAFSAKDFADGELADLPFLASLLGQLATARRGVLELGTELESKVGAFAVAAGSYRTGPYMTVSVSALEKNADAALALVREILLETKYDDADAVARLRRQLLGGAERSVQQAGDRYARLYVGQTLGEKGRCDELLEGFSQLRRLQGAATSDLPALARKLFTRARLTVSLSDNMPEAFARAAVAAFPAGTRAADAVRASAPETVRAKGFEIPADIGFSAVCARLPAETPFSGAHRVAARIVSLEHLWDAVRVKGGAYGASMSVGPDGEIFFTSYRDPNPAGACAAFKDSGRALGAFLDAGGSIEPAQVAAIGKMEPYRTPRAEATAVLEQYLNGRTPEYFQRRREEILNATPAELRAYADILSRLAGETRQCVVAGKDILATCALDAIEPVAAEKPADGEPEKPADGE